MASHYLEEEWKKWEGGKSIKGHYTFWRHLWGLKRYWRSGNGGLISAQVIGSVCGGPTPPHTGSNAQGQAALNASAPRVDPPSWCRSYAITEPSIDGCISFQDRGSSQLFSSNGWSFFASESLADRASDIMVQQCRQTGSKKEDGYWFQ